MALTTRPLGKADFDEIVVVIDKWWGGPTSALAHPIFFHELGKLARVAVDEDDDLCGFLFGFVCPDEPVGYVHLVGIHPDHRRRGVGRVLYEAFEADCVAAGCRALKAITTLGNEGSVRFHEALGWSCTQVDDYAGPDRPRYVFTRALPQDAGPFPRVR